MDKREQNILEGCKAALRAAKLALFVIEKHGVMPNDSWKEGFEKDCKLAETTVTEATLDQLLSYSFRDYIREAIRTESVVSLVVWKQNDEGIIGNNTNARLLHAAIGLSTEAGELLDVLKKNIFYGKPLDIVNVKEEAGDLLWYLAILFDALEADPYEVMRTNIAKLKARYPQKFESEQAITRDLATERKVLENPNQEPNDK